MTSRERMLAYMWRQEPDRVPRHAGFTPSLLEKVKEAIGGEEPGAHFDMDGLRGVGLKRPDDYQPTDYSRYFPELPEGTVVGGDGIYHAPGDYFHFTHIVSPLRDATTLKEIEEFPIEMYDGWTDDHMAAEVEKHKADGYATELWVGHLYESAWQIRGYEHFLVDLLERPAFAESILERLAERNRRAAVAGAKAGVDKLRTGDDIANQRALMFQPDLWRRTLKRHWGNILSAAKEIKPGLAVWYHSDGNVTQVIPDLIEIGITILNPVQPECMDPVQLKETYGDRLAFDGTIGTQTTFPWGTPDEMKRTVKRMIETVGKGGGLSLAPTHVLEPEVPVENIFAFFEACDEYGVYS